MDEQIPFWRAVAGDRTMTNRDKIRWLAITCEDYFGRLERVAVLLASDQVDEAKRAVADVLDPELRGRAVVRWGHGEGSGAGREVRR